MSNLVARLRNQKYNATIDEIYADSLEAADQIERLRKGWESLEWESKQEIERLEAENKENLNRYGRHTDDCRVSYRAGKRVKPCGCGLDAALENKDE
jgi:hypothetical protein